MGSPRTNATSPQTGVALANKELTPAFALKRAIGEWHKKYAKQISRADLTLHEHVGSGSFKQVRT